MTYIYIILTRLAQWWPVNTTLMDLALRFLHLIFFMPAYHFSDVSGESPIQLSS